MEYAKSEFVTKTRYRVDWRGKMILQVFNQDYRYTTQEYRNSQGTWRDAKVEDFLEVL